MYRNKYLHSSVKTRLRTFNLGIKNMFYLDKDKLYTNQLDKKADEK